MFPFHLLELYHLSPKIFNQHLSSRRIIKIFVIFLLFFCYLSVIFTKKKTCHPSSRSITSDTSSYRIPYSCSSNNIWYTSRFPIPRSFATSFIASFFSIPCDR